MDIKKISLNDETYPELLRIIQDPPHEIFCIGDISLLDTICVAVVGSRKCTSYGKNVALNIGEKLAENEITVVSGLARGIDSFSHQGALRGMGKTISVLGCGIDLCYPKENFRLKEEICEKGLVISEYPEGFKAMPYTFPRRNRIISGLSVTTVIVEAGIKSGSLITAEEAINQGRNVYAVPGNIDSIYSFGTNKLLKDGATPLTVIDDIMIDLGIEPKKPKKIYESLGEDEIRVFNVINKGGEVTIDFICYKTNIKPSIVSGIITILEMKGLIFSSLGKIFVAKF